MLQTSHHVMLAAGRADGGGSGVSIITPAPAELLWPTLAFFLLALVAGGVVFSIVRGVFRSRAELEQRVDAVERENDDLRRELEELRRSASV